MASAFVLNQGLPSLPAAPNPPIYPYTINSDGSFSAPATPVTWSSNLDVAVAMKRDAAGQFLFVIDQGASPTPDSDPRETS